MNLLNMTLFYVFVLFVSIILSVLGWNIGAKIKHKRTESRHAKDLAVIQEFENVD